MPGWGRARPGALGRGPVPHKGPLVGPNIPATGAQGLFTPKVPFHSACRLIDRRRGDPARVVPALHTPPRGIHPTLVRMGSLDKWVGDARKGTLLSSHGHSSATDSSMES